MNKTNKLSQLKRDKDGKYLCVKCGDNNIYTRFTKPITHKCSKCGKIYTF